MFTYIPTKLQSARKSIEEKHKRKVFMQKFDTDETLDKLIAGILATKDENLKMKAFSLTNEEVHMVASYIPHNYDAVNLSKLFSVFEFRISEEFCETLYLQWQHRYDYKECNEFLKSLIDKKTVFLDFLRGKNLKESILRDVLNTDDILHSYSEILRKQVIESECSLGERVSKYGIYENTRLYRDLKYLHFTFCMKSDYLNSSESEILSAIKKYGNKYLSQFVYNILDKLKLKELQDFKNIANYLDGLVGKFKEEEYNSFFKNFSKQFIQKYNDWINTAVIIQMFGTDERSNFWKKYRFKSVKWINRSDSVILEFDDMYATEFIDKRNVTALGPIYFYEKSVFEKMLPKYLYNDNSSVRSYLFNYWKNQKAGIVPKIIWDRREHSSGWENTVHSILIRYRITEKIL